MERQSSLLSRAFADHPRELGLGYLTHMKGALSICGSLIGVGVACFLHALVPGVLTRSASKTIERLHERMKARRGGSPGDNWLDHEI